MPSEPSKLSLDLGDDIFISAIIQNQLETTPTIVDTIFDALEQPCQNEFAAIAIWNACPMNHHK